MPEIPVIDIRGWEDPATRSEIAAQVDAACCEVGFFQVVGHGVEPGIVDRAVAATDAFFDLPNDAKLGVLGPKEINRGYTPIGVESLAYSLGVDTPPDLFEAFNIGRDVVDDTDPAVAAERGRIFADNLWPAEHPSMRAPLVEYFDAAADLTLRLSRIFATALGMPEDYFSDRCAHPTETLRILRYERQPGSPDPTPGQLRMGAHTDYGMVTVLWADPVPGLQIVGPDGEWLPITPEPGAFVVNLGDLTAQWTNDRWRSTIHRVVPPPPKQDGTARRRSMAFFQDIDHDALVECLPTCRSEGNPARYPPVTAGDHLLAKLGGSREGRKPETADTVGERLSAVVDV